MKMYVNRFFLLERCFLVILDFVCNGFCGIVGDFFMIYFVGVYICG